MHPTTIPMSESLPTLVPILLAPASLLAFALIPDRLANRQGRRFASLGAWCGAGVFGLAVIALILRFQRGPVVGEVWGTGPLALDVYFDSLSAVMMVLVAFLGAVVLRYSVNYLAGDPRQGRFTKWLAVTLGSVLALIVAGSLLWFTVAWVVTSLSLHQLLVFHPDRPAAVLAAWKKFFISRLGDACLVGALVLAWQCFGTWKF
ncbi:MAG TPA: hypothetical protein PLS03_02200, partial [Terrimicrobiaceae bacterium]|nr:hypothetical protein [Terrimicrobiaceae bacterium]